MDGFKLSCCCTRELVFQKALTRPVFKWVRTQDTMGPDAALAAHSAEPGQTKERFKKEDEPGLQTGTKQCDPTPGGLKDDQ